MRETLNILLEGTPRGVKLELVETAIRSIDGVNDVHDLHCWSIGQKLARFPATSRSPIFRLRSASAFCAT